MLYDVLIAGGGVAGLTAAIYARRAGMSALVLEKLFPGGQAANTYEIENYPGFLGISGPELAGVFEKHARKFDAEIVSAEINEITIDAEIKRCSTSAGEFAGKTLIIATGARPRLLDIPGEREFNGRGVSYCATCDGAFYRNKDVAVVGGGNTAIEDAIFLSRMCKTVYLIHRRDSFRADKSLVDRLAGITNIELLLDCVPESISGNELVTGLSIANKKTAEKRVLVLDGVFVAIGSIPNNSLILNKIETDNGGYIITDMQMATSEDGVFAAGDVRVTPLRQIITAAADGAVAAYSASAYIATKEPLQEQLPM